MGIDQLNLFEVNEGTVNKSTASEGLPLFQLHELVRVKKPESTLNPEDFHYIYSFAGKKGIVQSIKTVPNGRVCYEVEFSNDRIGIFYEEDIER